MVPFIITKSPQVALERSSMHVLGLAFSPMTFEQSRPISATETHPDWSIWPMSQATTFGQYEVSMKVWQSACDSDWLLPPHP